jgi:hypothetical protein
MENLSYVIREYGIKNLGYTDNLMDYIEFIQNDSLEVKPPRYEIESLVRDPESGKDSLLVDFTDEFHLSHFDSQKLRDATTVGDSIITDSMHVYVVPHLEFDKIPVSILVLTCDNPIHMKEREKNVTDHAILIWADSPINYDWIVPDPYMMASREALISIPPEELGECPTSHLPYKLNVNVRSVLEGAVHFTVQNDSAEVNITQDTLMYDLLNHRLKTEALAEVLVLIKEDSTLIEKKDSLLTDYFIERVKNVKPQDTYEVTSDHTVSVPADSMVNWDDELRIRRSVFVAHVDSLSLALKKIEEFKQLAPRVSYEETYIIAKIDTIGVTIKCPIDSMFTEPDKSFYQRIFGVGAPENHGQVENGDLSWSEKK